jgi:hypothetical protein
MDINSFNYTKFDQEGNTMKMMILIHKWENQSFREINVQDHLKEKN